jgi:hypothetical protein
MSPTMRSIYFCVDCFIQPWSVQMFSNRLNLSIIEGKSCDNSAIYIRLFAARFLVEINMIVAYIRC